MSSDRDRDLKRFDTFILKLNNGSVNEELSEVIKKCVREISDACHDRGGKNEASLKLTLKFVMDQKDRIVEIYPAIDEKYPKVPMGRAGMFFAGIDGELLRENPRQETFEDELERQRKKRLADAEAITVKTEPLSRF